MKRATVLDELATAAVGRAEVLRGGTDLSALYQEALLFEKRDFAGALSAPGLSVISEIKRASPSAGFIREADPAEWGARYESEGAACISVLTEPERFEGSLEDLDAARANTTLPILRKDFTVDEAQILETGTRADAVLLIAALFEAAALARYISLAVEVGLTPLVEIHDEQEANLALESGARVIGVNNRDLRDFTVDLATFERLAPKLAGATLVAESGIKTPEDARRLRNAGADAVLVGEAAMRDPGLVARLASLPLVAVCLGAFPPPPLQPGGVPVRPRKHANPSQRRCGRTPGVHTVGGPRTAPALLDWPAPSDNETTMEGGERYGRRSIRLKGYDYTRDGAYFVTLCTRDREHTFRAVVDGEMRPNAFGRAVADCWTWLAERYPYVHIDESVVMPDHTHAIIVITDAHDDANPKNATNPNQTCRGGSRTAQIRTALITGPVEQPTNDTHALPTQRKPLGRLVGAFKTVSTKRVNDLRDTPNTQLWQRNYHERVIRNSLALHALRRYIANNPVLWQS